MIHKVLFWFYLLLALCLYIYSIQIYSHYFNLNHGWINGIIQSQVLITHDLLSTPIGTFVAIEDVILLIVLGAWIYFEDKTIKNGFLLTAFLIWTYFMSVGVWFALFMSFREYKLWKQNDAKDAV